MRYEIQGSFTGEQKPEGSSLTLERLGFRVTIDGKVPGPGGPSRPGKAILEGVLQNLPCKVETGPKHLACGVDGQELRKEPQKFVVRYSYARWDETGNLVEQGQPVFGDKPYL